MSFLKKISSFLSRVTFHLEAEVENIIVDYIFDGENGLKPINISEIEKEKIIKWKIKEFKKFLKFGDGFEKSEINLDLFKDWEKKNQQNFNDWCEESNNDYNWFELYGDDWKIYKEKFDDEVKKLKSNITL
tara:strand:+ start:177 stop:569 length:393 start_codon:yes stop_codon:yes gene_type:complete